LVDDKKEEDETGADGRECNAGKVEEDRDSDGCNGTAGDVTELDAVGATVDVAAEDVDAEDEEDIANSGVHRQRCDDEWAAWRELARAA